MTAKKTPARKSANKTAKKATPRKSPASAAKKTPARKAAVKKTVATKTVVKKKSAGKTSPASKSASKKTPAKKTTSVKKAPIRKAPAKDAKKQTRAKPGVSAEEVAKKVHKANHTPAVFKIPSKKQTPIVFTLEDVREVLKKRDVDKETIATQETSAEDRRPGRQATRKIAKEEQTAPAAARVLGAATLADILGDAGMPQQSGGSTAPSKKTVDPRFQRYYDLLIELRDHVRDEIEHHTRETLKRSAKEDAGDLSSYSQHMADAGSESFDRDFALSLVSSEAEALAEINAALERIYNGSYGICEVTGQPISEERLLAVPFTRFSREGQEEYERTNRRSKNRKGMFLDTDGVDTSGFGDDGDE